MTTELPHDATYNAFGAFLARWAFRTLVGTFVATWFALAATKGSAGFLGCLVVLVATAMALAWTDFVACRRGATWFSEWLRFGWYWVAWLQIALVPEAILGFEVLDLTAHLFPASYSREFEPPEGIVGAAVATALFAAAKLVLLLVLGGVSLLVHRGWQRSFERARRRRDRGPPTSAPRPEASR